MNLSDWLIKQQGLYPRLPDATPTLSWHPVSGTQQESPHMKSRFWWGGGASQEACEQLETGFSPELTNIAVLTFGPVQNFLGGGQKLRDWAVASWLCHYLSAVLIYRWETELNGQVLLPYHRNSELIKWLRDDAVDAEKFWQAELPNVITGLHPSQNKWLEDCENIINEEWLRFVKALEQAVINHPQYRNLFNGQGWRVIHNDCQYLWYVYAEEVKLNIESANQDIKNLHELIEKRKVSRQWKGTWWGGRSSPSDGCLSIQRQFLSPATYTGSGRVKRKFT
ncbi:type III-B CRISPR-associated protein Cas10/Cmr2 [Kamptonema formosum]|uniref:type III-B CRISPR-associated protein Cas10/Cmr2 n=1 Tax=Kamptonema formosum TaxID=331992 RepID=UPI00034DC418|nr:type III-B CRISPR-associated protein Cas10/Cmr2 [Kamptonema formosum]